MSDPIERAIDEMADELAAMGKAMSRDSKRIEKLQAENERLWEEMKQIRDCVRHGGVMHVGSIEKLIREHFDVARKALRQAEKAEGTS